jgi:hypothetical protein
MNHPDLHANIEPGSGKDNGISCLHVFEGTEERFAVFAATYILAELKRRIDLGRLRLEEPYFVTVCTRIKSVVHELDDEHNDRAEDLRKELRFFQYGFVKQPPPEWGRYLQHLDPEWSEYLRLQRKFA